MALNTRVRGGQLKPSEFTITTTGNIDDLDFGDAATIRMNNATLSTLRGLKAGTAGQRVVIVSIGAGEVDFAHQNTGSTAANRLINRVTSGITPLAPGLGIAMYEYDGTTARWRLVSHEQGAPITVPFSAGNFTVSAGTGTWVVASGNQSAFTYLIVGSQMHLNIVLNATTITLAPTNLKIAFPNGYTSSNTAWGLAFIYDNSSSTFAQGAADVPGSAQTGVAVFKFDQSALQVSSGNTYIRVLMPVPIT